MHAPDSGDDPQIVVLLDRWHELREGGREPTLSELTDDPVLIEALGRAIAAIEYADWALGGGAESSDSRAQGVENRYEIVGAPAIGGMGEVYQATDLQMNGRVVAYKVMKPGLDLSPTLVAQFYREAVITDALRQPGVVPIYAKVMDGSKRPAYVMEFIQGEDLHSAIKKITEPPADDTPPKTDADLLGRFLDACRIVGVAHRIGYVHADLNLKNIMIVAGSVGTRVVDWGSAVKIGSEDELRPNHAVAPEYRDIALSAVDPPSRTSDVFALGVGLGKLADALAAIGRPIVEGVKLSSSLRALRAITIKSIDERPERRYPEAGMMADDIQLVLSGQRPLADQDEPFGETSWRWISQHRAGVSAAVATSLLFAICLALLAVAYGRASLKELEAKQSRAIMLTSQMAAILATCDFLLAEVRMTPDKDNGGLTRLLGQIIDSKDRNPEVVTESLRAFLRESKRQDSVGSELAASHRAKFEQRLDRGMELLDVLIREHPESSRTFRISLARSYICLGILRIGRQPDAEGLASAIQAILNGRSDTRPERAACEEVLGLLDKAEASLPLLESDNHPESDIALCWREALQFRMVLFLYLGRCTEGLQALDRLVSFMGGRDGSPLSGLRALILKAAEMEQQHLPWSRPPAVQHAKAARLANYVALQSGVSKAAVYNAACALSLASLDDSADLNERNRRADQAVMYLSRIASDGYFQTLRLFPLPPRNTIHELRTDHDLDPLRSRPDFLAIVDRFRGVN